MRILVTGGAGYIGSHMTRMLIKLGHSPVVLDSLEIGHRRSLPDNVDFYQGNVGDAQLLEKIFAQHSIEIIIHFSGYSQAGESFQNPQKYFDNNLVKPTTLLNLAVTHNIKKIIFSSTAAVYGQPDIVPIPESPPLLPTNPYGLSKLYFEQLLSYFDRIYGLKYVSLRYFNACGADLSGQHGEDHRQESHIIPVALKSLIDKKPFNLFGTDYPTPDGTCVRDYIHVEDLCLAHISAMDALINNHLSDYFNVASGIGWSNRQIIDIVEKVSGDKLTVVDMPRRPGDPAKLIADPSKIKSELGWSAKYSDLTTIIKSAWDWHTSHPQGYPV